MEAKPEAGFEVNEKNVREYLAYYHFRSWYALPYLLLLQTNALQSILCEKARFTKGTWADCEAFYSKRA